jgi:hypothetical protein
MTRPPPPHGFPRRRSVLRALGAAGLRFLFPAAAAGAMLAPRAALGADPELTQFEVSRDDEGVYLSFAVSFELGRSPDEALMKSVPLFFVAEAEVYRERWYWRNRRVAQTTRVWKVVFQPLTSTYRVTTEGGLSQSYPTRAEAIAAVSRSTRWKVAEASHIEDGSRHYLEFEFRLDVNLLPRPMQIGVGGQPDWRLSVKRSQRIN